MGDSILIPCGVGYLYVYETHKELPCGCRYQAPYQGMWVRVSTCDKHRLETQLAKIAEINRREFSPTDSEVFCDACNDIECQRRIEKDVKLLGICQ